MKYAIYDEASLVRRWYYDAGGTQCTLCFAEDLDTDWSHGMCERGNYRFVRTDSRGNEIWLFCLEDIHSKKQARTYSAVAVRAYSDMRAARDVDASSSLEASDVAAHNIKNLNAQITSKVLTVCDEERLAQARDKVGYIAEKTQGDPTSVAKVLLGVLLASKQMAAEFNIIDYMEEGVALQESEFASHKIHHLLVLAFYLYDAKLSERRIRVRLPKTLEKVRVNFATIQTVFYQIFDNACKYCATESEIGVSVQASLFGYVDIVFEMVSLCITDDDLVGLGKIGFRGEHAGQIAAPAGKGIGMAVVKRLVGLNNGEFFIRRVCDELASIEGVPYGRNEFVIRLPMAV